MKLNKNNLIYATLCYTLLIGLFFIEKNNLAKSIIIPNQDLSLNTPISTTKNIALTFDDGPYGTSTEKILDILKQEKVHATFFVIGKNVDKFPALAQRIVAEGNLIENHSYDHSEKLTEMSATTFQKNIQKAEGTILSHTGQKSKLFRPPYGNITAQMYGKLNDMGYKTVMWNTETQDWDDENSPAELIEKIIIQNAKPNDIILMHDGRDTKINYPRNNTIEALSYIIKQLKKEGYSFVTVDKIVGSKAYFD